MKIATHRRTCNGPPVLNQPRFGVQVDRVEQQQIDGIIQRGELHFAENWSRYARISARKVTNRSSVCENYNTPPLFFQKPDFKIVPFFCFRFYGVEQQQTNGIIQRGELHSADFWDDPLETRKVRTLDVGLSDLY